jgi:RNA polymerase sigma factor (sigma-70 family)
MPPPAEGLAARFVLGPALRTQPDRRLVALVRDGYEMAFDEIVRRYGGPLRRYAAAIVGGRSEDVTQDAFSRALLALRRDGAEIELRPWLFRIVRNTALNDLRDRPPSHEALADAPAGGPNPAEELERREELAGLIRQLQSLPEPQRAAIVMRELEGLSHEEIAAALGLSGGAARQAIYRARRALRDGLGMLLPVPLLKTLLAGNASMPVEAAAGAVGAGGAGVAVKAAAATVLVAGAVGAGVAIDHGHRPEGAASAGVKRVRRGNSSPATTAALHSGPAGHGTATRSERESGSDSNGGGHETGGKPGALDHGGGGGGHGGDSAPASGPGDREHSGSHTAAPGSGDGKGGEPSSQDDGPDSGGSSGPGGGSESGGGESGSSGPDDGSATSTGDVTPSGDSPDSNSSPDSGDGGGGRLSGSDDLRDPHGTSVFSVQETQP